jgi:hypothetical protein
MGAVAWMLAGRKWDRMRQSVLGGALALSIVPLFWMKGPGWYWVSTLHPEDVLKHPFSSRTELRRPAFDMLALQRNLELGPGDLALFDQDVTFIGALWNFDFSNQVRYVEYQGPGPFLAALGSMSPKWVAVGRDSDARKTIERTGRWELVGDINPGGDVVFRRAAGAPQ